MRELQVERCQEPASCLDEWADLHDNWKPATRSRGSEQQLFTSTFTLT
jgi:hypothetical protein